MRHPQFSIRTLLWLTLAVAIDCAVGAPVIRSLNRWLWPPEEAMTYQRVSIPIKILEEDEALLATPAA